jgi:hypothetical protein
MLSISGIPLLIVCDFCPSLPLITIRGISCLLSDLTLKVVLAPLSRLPSKLALAPIDIVSIRKGKVIKLPVVPFARASICAGELAGTGGASSIGATLAGVISLGGCL